MEIRQLNPQDAIQYQRIRLEALQENPEAFGSSYEEEKKLPIDYYIERLKSENNSFTFGAFLGLELIGVVTLVRETKIKLHHRANIFAMYVKEDNRGHGIGKALLTEAINKARQLAGIEQLYLTVVSTNDSAKGLYSSMGFEVFGTERNALKYNNRYYNEEHRVLFL